MRDLIERLKAADGPSRELDTEIAINIGKCDCRCKYDRFTDKAVFSWIDQDERGNYIENGVTFQIRNYTNSLDAAMSLVPEICDVRRFSDDPSGTVWELGEFKDGEITWLGESVTAGQPAHGLTIAALEAQAAMQRENAG